MQRYHQRKRRAHRYRTMYKTMSAKTTNARPSQTTPTITVQSSQTRRNRNRKQNQKTALKVANQMKSIEVVITVLKRREQEQNHYLNNTNHRLSPKHLKKELLVIGIMHGLLIRQTVPIKPHRFPHLHGVYISHNSISRSVSRSSRRKVTSSTRASRKRSASLTHNERQRQICWHW